ncbi:DUF3426 domain-containing protein [Amantichitinum ursilacus]|uniref:Zinc finger/thioredoxin putative domain-containing protein n=1 Tax=Amantichitinum ursilacus TaxID=857265 RepID=A0A0N0GP74_9NEIS|nr:DUF3426 domain-containing protein [Amantichitinum ursilacus]KPC53519.1 hypothetical protein WG78_08360 [Amantichitinum ursilacus]
MNHVTRCPNCRTAFKVSDTQLAAHGGKVRCGKCAFVFNARDCLEEAPAPAPVVAEAAPALVATPAPAAVAIPAPSPAPVFAPEPEPAPVFVPEAEAAFAPSTEPAFEPDFADPAPAPEVATDAAHPAEPDDEPEPFPVKAERFDLRTETVSTDYAPAEAADDAHLDEFNAAIEAAYRDALNQIPAQAELIEVHAPGGTTTAPVHHETEPGQPARDTHAVEATAETEESVSDWLQHAYVPAVAAMAAEAEALDHDPATAPEAVATVLVHGQQPLAHTASAPQYQPIHTAEDDALLALPVKRSPLRLLLVPLVLLLLALLLVQVGLRYRNTISTDFPWLRAPLVSVCGVLGCEMPLPRDATLLRNEYSELVFVPDRPDLIQLSASLRNLAPYDQALPSLELTLTNASDEVVAKKVFKASEYLAANEKKRASLGVNDELHVFLQLDAGALHSTGYTLNWFYP